MKRRLTFLTAGIDALFTVVLGNAVLLGPTTLIWLFENDPTINWFVAYRTSADLWLAAQGTDIVVASSKILGMQVDQFTIQFLPLGFTALLAWLAFRVGRRFSVTPQLWPAWTGSILAYGASALFLSSTAYDSAIYPINWQGTFLPTLFFSFWMLIGSLFGTSAQQRLLDLPVAAERQQFKLWWQEKWRNTGWVIRAVASPALRAGSGVVLILLASSATLLALMVGFNWINIINFYEALQVSVLGGITVTVGQIAILPNLIVFGASWLTGVGFAIGDGSHFSPIGAAAGPLPNLPVLAALPPGQLGVGAMFIMVPLLAAALSTFAVKKHAAEIRFEFANPFWAALSLGLSIGLVAAIELGLLGALASGAVGPGRLQLVGVSPFVLGLVTFFEVATISTIAAFYVAKPQRADHPLLTSSPRG
ncbi:MAG: hypothetical protein KGL41_02020 [Actinomycetales bacterium]|nr:hypothetical protein [Actinomycetales bacterium]